ncbi:oocyte zinc finger protein XlCOF7.1-like [Bufo bufo]|uniref:oocyte zinc finger protein XlCOF7.1-like n=1 Tax=Bufo bufo TaxID=8384 RepID=UPI001ABE0B3C|nr:oocyte zinc finger protein XlCOF7.1-like [Bufo bufo]XP_040294902.1 oocyte zinc finger protein XlCOF7.1-like [Bufo bufo]XP_040294903.1 oocyte zinc finger protein XlCOF7.1-like [Bufo bufo]
MDKDRNHMSEKILNLTLEIIYLLTGEDYAPVSRSTLHVSRSSVPHKSERSCRTQSVLMDQDKKNDQKILDLTNKIIQLLTGEVPVRYEDIMVSFTMEEWEYVEGHKDLYKYVLMEDQDLDSSKDLKMEEAEVEDDHGLPAPPCLNEDARDIQAKAGSKASKCRKPWRRRAKFFSKRKDKFAPLKNMPTDDRPPENIPNSESCMNEDGNSSGDVLYSATNAHNPSSEIKPLSDGSYTLNDHTQDTNTAIQTKQQLSGTGGNSTGEDVDTKPSHPEFSSCIRGSPIDTFIATSHTQAQYLCTPIKEEAVPPEADNYGPTQYPSIHGQEESNGTGTNIYEVSPTQYTLAHIKRESVLCEEEADLHSSIYILPDHTQTPSQVKVEPVSQEEGYEIYIPTDSTQRLHTSASRQTMNRNKGASKTYKRFSVTKYRDWNKTSESAPYTNRQVVEGMYVCSTCEKTFTSHFGLVKHQAMHNGNKVSCPQCGKLFLYKSSLVIHQRIHTGEKLFTCPVCNKCFTNHSNLVVHQRIHTGEKPFVCLECGKRFGHKGHLNRHLKTHEAEKPATSIENYVNNSLRDHWNSRKINGWSHNIYDTGIYSTYNKRV